MKKIVLLSLLTLVVFTSCQNNRKSADGWYRTDNGKDILGEPIVSVNDFLWIRVDSVPAGDSMHYEIIGRLKPEGARRFADATEQNIGKTIAFLYKGEMIAKPMVNMRIEGGYFSITTYYTDRAKTFEIYEDLKSRIEPSPQAVEPLSGVEIERFDSLFSALEEGWKTGLAYSSNTGDIRKLPEYELLLEMGKKIIPSLIVRLSVEQNFFALPLYEDLQDNPDLLPGRTGGEQARAAEAVTRYIEHKLGRPRRQFASDQEKIAALRDLFEKNGWDAEKGYSRAQQDSMMLRMDYEITEDMMRMLADGKE